MATSSPVPSPSSPTPDSIQIQTKHVVREVVAGELIAGEGEVLEVLPGAVLGRDLVGEEVADELIGKDIGLGWDGEKKTIAASDEWWEAKIQDVFIIIIKWSGDEDYITKNKVLVFVVANVTNYFMNYVVKNPCRDSSMTCHRWVSEILNGHLILCYQMFRMKKLVFLELCDILETNIFEQVGLFLYMLSQPGSVRNCEERFQHSGETIYRHFHSVLEVVCMFANDIIKPVDPSFRDTPDEILKDVRYRPYFRDCIGAIDGVYIGRKGYTTTNVMAVCEFSMCFTFVWAGWEGSAHDTKIFMEVNIILLILGRTRKLSIISRNLEFGLESGGELKFLIIIILVFEVQLNVHLVYVKQDERYWSDGEFDSLDEDNEYIDSNEDESEVGPSTTTWEESDAQSKWNDLENL
uniref:Uncharacterized protein n=1 Tax=Glycine max TaxID=3847 RepID=A0A0R0KSP5_SOYBN